METSFIMQTVYIEKKEESTTTKKSSGQARRWHSLPKYDKFILIRQ